MKHEKHEKHKEEKMERKKGGKVEHEKKPHKASGDPEVLDEAEDEKDGFKKGGKACRKEGGKVEGEKAHHRLDKAKRASGGCVKSPLSSASRVVSDRG